MANGPLSRTHKKRTSRGFIFRYGHQVMTHARHSTMRSVRLVGTFRGLDADGRGIISTGSWWGTLAVPIEEIFPWDGQMDRYDNLPY